MSATSAGASVRFIAWLVRWFFRLMRWRVDVRGIQHIPDRGGAIVTFNHHSYADFLASGLPILDDGGRVPRFLAKQELFEKPLLGRLLRNAGQVPVARGSRSGREDAFASAVDRLRAGELIVLAPEQTISESFDLLPFTTGTARMAQRSGVPVVPSVSWGSQRFATKGQPTRWRAGRRIPVLVRYGEPMVIGPDEDLREANDRLRTRMEEMLHEVQREYPEEPEPGEEWWLPARMGGTAPPHEEVVARHQQRESRWREE
jgi:1-acyl-sn-glycerol-3-phosphate acyltransferase